MNREIETLINNLEGCIGMFDYILTPIENNLLLIHINEKEQENKELHNKIDKAIEFIECSKEHILEHDGSNIYLTQYCIDELLKILKDSDVDE